MSNLQSIATQVIGHAGQTAVFSTIGLGALSFFTKVEPRTIAAAAIGDVLVYVPGLLALGQLSQVVNLNGVLAGLAIEAALVTAAGSLGSHLFNISGSETIVTLLVGMGLFLGAPEVLRRAPDMYERAVAAISQFAP